MNKIKSKIDYVLKHNKFAFSLYYFLGSLFFRAIGLFIPIKKNRVLISGHGRKYNDSPKAIYEYLISNNEFNYLEIYWALEDTNVEIPGICKKIKVDTWKYFRIALSSKYWITCVNIERGLRFKKKKTIYLNTWHGTPIKSIGGVRGRRDDDFSHIDLFCTCGEYEKAQLKKAFKVKDKSFIYSGLPRNDELYSFDKKLIVEIKNRLGISLDKKIILYAPTWRDSEDGKDYNIKPPINFEKWKKILGNDYVVLLRLHPYTTKLLNISFDEFVMDYSSYSSINDLLIISDILISDYSAVIFDYSILERPIICFGYDYDDYKKNRGFALDLHREIPGGVLSNEEDVLSVILGDKETLIGEVKRFKHKYLEYGGNATKECVISLFRR